MKSSPGTSVERAPVLEKSLRAVLFLEEVLCREGTRRRNTDETVRYGKRWFRLTAASPKPPAGTKVIIRERRDQAMPGEAAPWSKSKNQNQRPNRTRGQAPSEGDSSLEL